MESSIKSNFNDTYVKQVRTEIKQELSTEYKDILKLSEQELVHYFFNGRGCVDDVRLLIKYGRLTPAIESSINLYSEEIAKLKAENIGVY